MGDGARGRDADDAEATVRNAARLTPPWTAVPANSNAGVRSDTLASRRNRPTKVSWLLGPAPPEWVVVVDASDLIADVRWRLAHRARTSLLECVESTAVIAVVPSLALREVERKLLPMRTRWPQAAIDQVWTQLRARLRVVDPPRPAMLSARAAYIDARDRTDSPYVWLFEFVAADLLVTRDRDFKGLGPVVIAPEELKLIKGFARAAARKLVASEALVVAPGFAAIVMFGALVYDGARALARRVRSWRRNSPTDAGADAPLGALQSVADGTVQLLGLLQAETRAADDAARIAVERVKATLSFPRRDLVPVDVMIRAILAANHPMTATELAAPYAAVCRKEPQAMAGVVGKLIRRDRRLVQTGDGRWTLPGM